MALDEDHLGHRVAILEAGHHTHHPVALVLLGGLIGRRPKRALGLDHRLALGLGGHQVVAARDRLRLRDLPRRVVDNRSEEHTSELQSLAYLVCRLLLEKKKKKY